SLVARTWPAFAMAWGAPGPWGPVSEPICWMRNADGIPAMGGGAPCHPGAAPGGGPGCQPGGGPGGGPVGCPTEGPGGGAGGPPGGGPASARGGGSVPGAGG